MTRLAGYSGKDKMQYRRDEQYCIVRFGSTRAAPSDTMRKPPHMWSSPLIPLHTLLSPVATLLEDLFSLFVYNLMKYRFNHHEDILYWGKQHWMFSQDRPADAYRR